MERVKCSIQCEQRSWLPEVGHAVERRLLVEDITRRIHYNWAVH